MSDLNLYMGAASTVAALSSSIAAVAMWVVTVQNRKAGREDRMSRLLQQARDAVRDYARVHERTVRFYDAKLPRICRSRRGIQRGR